MLKPSLSIHYKAKKVGLGDFTGKIFYYSLLARRNPCGGITALNKF
jgi:hypothetical protein